MNADAGDGIIGTDARLAALSLELLAGNINASGNSDGMDAAASFSQPLDVAVDSAGNFYVADTLNSTIREVTSKGVVTTLAGLAGSAGSADGPAAMARFNNPKALTVDSAGNIYVADSNNFTIRKITPIGLVSTLAGLANSSGNIDGMGSNARFANPRGITVDSAGNLYVADATSFTIRKVTPIGEVSTLAGSAGVSGSSDGGTVARFNAPRGIAVDVSGNMYVADSLNNTIRKVTPEGEVATLAGAPGVFGSADGTGALARFNQPEGVIVDSNGNVYVSDTVNATIRKITPTGDTTTIAGAAGATGIVLAQYRGLRLHAVWRLSMAPLLYAIAM